MKMQINLTGTVTEINEAKTRKGALKMIFSLGEHLCYAYGETAILAKEKLSLNKPISLCVTREVIGRYQPKDSLKVQGIWSSPEEKAEQDRVAAAAIQRYFGTDEIKAGTVVVMQNGIYDEIDEARGFFLATRDVSADEMAALALALESEITITDECPRIHAAQEAFIARLGLTPVVTTIMHISANDHHDEVFEVHGIQAEPNLLVDEDDEEEQQKDAA